MALATLIGACPSAGAPPRPIEFPADLSANPARATALAPKALRAPVYPLKVGPTRRYLVDQRNVPFLIVGDSPQSLMVNLSENDAAYFLADRRAAGFNAVWINLLCNSYTGGRPDGSTYDGIRPFTTNGDLSTPNERYFAHADAIIRLAARFGMVVFLDPIETGGWHDVLAANGAGKAYDYGRYVGTRYRRFPNIVWLNGNDFETWRDAADDAVVLAVAKGIEAADHTHIQTVELNYLRSSSLDDARWRHVIALDAAYTYHPTYAEVSKEFGRRQHLPIFMIEANYEFEHDYTGAKTLRRQEYWSLLSGATGQFYGNKYTWQFLDAWKLRLRTKGVEQLRYVTDLLARRDWFKLIPDRNHTVVTGGYGTFSSAGEVNASEYVTAARTPDGRLVIAYLPTRRTVTIDMTKLAGPVAARWYDPTRGTYIAVSRSRLPNAGKKRFTPPSANGDGGDDWVLVLTAA